LKYKYNYKNKYALMNSIGNVYEEIEYYNNLFIYESKVGSVNAYIYTSENILINTNKLSNKIINYIMLQGKKHTAYNIYKNGMNLFFSFFSKFNSELNETYKLYNLYYTYSKDNANTFYRSNFVFNNILEFLQPAFTLGFKRAINMRSKKIDKKKKDITINYVAPNRRLLFSLKMILLYSKSFNFGKKYVNFCYCILNTFLNNRNSPLYLKKIATYERLLKSKKMK